MPKYFAAPTADPDDTPDHTENQRILRRDGWKQMLTTLEEHLATLAPAERERVETAATVVREFRNRVRSGGINFGGPGPEPGLA